MFYQPVWEYEGFQLVERPDTPNYAIYWRERRGGRPQRKSTGTRDLAKAKQILVAFAHEKLNAKGVKRSAERTMLLDVLCDYVEAQEGRGLTYWPACRTTLKHIGEWVERDSTQVVADFGLDAQSRYVEWRRETLRKNGYSASNATVNRELTDVKAAMRLAWKRGRLESVPHIQLLPSPPPRDRFLRVHEVQRLLSECHEPHLLLYVMLALHTLQRPIAIFSLRVEQVDLDFGRIDFLAPGAIQSFKRRPVVPITRTLRPHLEEAIDHSASGHVLEYFGRPLRSVKKAFKGACVRAQVEDCTPYTLRHTGATLMAAAGVPLRQVAGMLGHTEQRTTEIYAKHHPDFLGHAASALDDLFSQHRNETAMYKASATTERQTSKAWSSPQE